MHKDTKELENSHKKKLGWIAFLFVIFHFGTIIITILPDTYTNSKIKKVSNYYVTPLFSQSWAMFVPCPLTDNNISYQFFYKGKATDLIKPSINNFNYHSKFRFTHHGDLAVGEYNMLYWIKLDLDKLNIKPNRTLNTEEINKFKKTNGYFYLRQYLKGSYLNSFNSKPDSILVNLNYFDVVNDIQNVYTIKYLK